MIRQGADQVYLCRVEWQLFCTLSFKGRVPGPVRCQRMLFAWLRTIGRFNGVHFHLFPWAVRSEHGGLTERFHYHALIAGLPGCVDSRLCFRLMNLWEHFGGGMARIRPYDDSLEGVRYVLKGLSDLNGRTVYEMARFGKVGELTLARCLVSTLVGRKERRRHSWSRQRFGES